MSLSSFAEYNRLISLNNQVIIACLLLGGAIQIQPEPMIAFPALSQGFLTHALPVSLGKLATFIIVFFFL